MVLVFKSSLFYLIMAPKHKRSDAGHLNLPKRRCQELTFPSPYNFEVEPVFKSVSKSYNLNYCGINSHVLSTGGT